MSLLAHSVIDTGVKSTQTGLDIGRRLLEGLGESPAAIVLHTANNHDTGALLSGLTSAVGPNSLVIGCSAQGVMGRGFVKEGGYVAGAMALGGTGVHAASARADRIDNAVNCMVAKHQLERLGGRVTFAENGMVALDRVDESIDVILMDCQMPVMDGYEASTKIRQPEADGRRVPIIALTASAMREDRERCLAAGMDDYVTKPIRPNQLKAALMRALGCVSKDPSPVAR